MITILGVLAAIVVFSVAGIGDKGQAAACQTDRNTFETAEEAYYADNGAYGTELELVGKYLSTESAWYDVTPDNGADPKTYELTLTSAGTTAGCTV